MKTRITQFISIGSLLIFCFVSCNHSKTGIDPNPQMTSTESNERDFIKTLQRHLDAVTDKDIGSLKSTLSPNGQMQLILADNEILRSTKSFLEAQNEWFQVETLWTFETRILNTEIGQRIGFAVVETIYREPDRDGAPYFNRMVISYGLKKIDSKWCIILDHASSVEKSTDAK